MSNNILSQFPILVVSIAATLAGAGCVADPDDTADFDAEAKATYREQAMPGAPMTVGVAPPTGQWLSIEAQHSAKCVDVYANQTGNEVNIQQWTCTGATNQKFVLVDAGAGYYNIIGQHSGKCLDVYAKRTGNDVNIQQFTCTGADNQAFMPLDMGDGYYALVAKHSGKCVDVYAMRTTDGANIQQFTCNFTSNQRFQFVP